jgi:peptidoglycan/LPS O-acetylase OafA/YrhL
LAQPFFGKLGIEPDSSLMFLFCAISCLLGALLLRYTIEKPFLKLRDEILKKKKTQKKALIADN